MIQKTKRPISILLVLLMIVGMFSVLPISAGAATWTFKLNSNFSGEWNADTDVVSEQPIELNLAEGDYEFQIVAYEDGNLSSYRGNEQAGNFTETYSQVMHDNGGNAKFHADGGKYTLTYNAGDGVLTINPVYVAEINGTNYKTLADAFAAAVDGDTITLLADCAGNGIKVTPAGKFATNGLTVDFAGFTYTVDGETVGSTGTETNGFQLLKNNKVTFTNGTITSAKAKILVQNYSNLTLDGMTLTLDNPDYTSAYTLSNNNGNIVIDDTTINANPAGGFAFDVCRFSSYPSVNVTVTGNSVINGDVEISASGSDAKEGFSLTLESGTMNGDIVVDASAQALVGEDNKVTKAATFTQEAPEGFKWDANGVLVPVEYVAQIGTTKYETLADAFAAAVDGDTITLLANCAGNGIKVTPAGKFATNGLTVDFAGFTYTVDGETVGSTGTETNGFQLLKNNKVTFTNGTITSAKAKILVQNYSDLTLDGMTLTLNNPDYASAYTLSNNNGNIVIDDTTINANPAGGFAFDVCRYSSYPSVHVTVTGNSQINGDVEIFASKGDAKEGFSLTLESGSMTGDIVVDASAQALVGEDNKVTKADTFTQEAPEGFKWVDNGDNTASLAPDYVASVNGDGYMTFAEAVDARNATSDVISLLKAAGTYTSEDHTEFPIKVEKNSKSLTVKIDDAPYYVTSSAADGVTTYTAVEGKVKYTTLTGVVSYKSNIDYTNVSGSGTYQLLDDITANSRIVPGLFASNVTIDLNGHTLTSTATDTAFLFSRAGSAASHNSYTITNGTIIAPGDGIQLLADNADLTLDGVTVNAAGDYGIVTNGTKTGNNITVTDSDITADAAGIYKPSNGTLTLTDTSVEGDVAVYVKSGTVAINGGTFTGTGAKADYTYNGNGINPTGDAIVIDSCGYPGGAPSVSIGGNPTINSTNGVEIGDYAGNGVTELAAVTATDNSLTLPTGLKWVETDTPGVYEVGLEPVDLFVGYGLSLQGDIGLIFYLDPAAAGIDIADVDSVAIDFDCDHYTYQVTDFAKDGNYIKVTCYVPAAYMAHDIKAYHVKINDVALDDTDTYSVQEYAERIIADPVGCNIPAAKADEAVALMKEMLNYGAKAQEVFKNQMLAPADYDDLGEKYDYTMATVTADMIGNAIKGEATDMSTIHPEADANFYAPSVIYLSKTTLRMIFLIPTGNGSTCPDEYDGHQGVWYHYVDVTDIPAAELDEQQSFNVNGVTFHYSVLDYAKGVVAGGSPAQKDLAASLYLYNQAANAFFAD